MKKNVNQKESVKNYERDSEPHPTQAIRSLNDHKID